MMSNTTQTLNKRKNLLNSFIGVCFILILAQHAWAKNPTDYLHSASNLYIDGRIQEAKIELEDGLKQYPSDPQLTALANHLAQIKPPPPKDGQGQGGEGDKSDQDKKDQGKDSTKSDQNKDDKQNQDKKEQDKKKGEEQKQKEAQENPADKDKNPADTSAQNGGEAPPPKPGELSPEEAKRLLKSFENDEKNEIERNRKQSSGQGRPAQDW